jgi:hypothetical protein
MFSLIRQTGESMIIFISLVFAAFLGGVVALVGAVVLLVLLLDAADLAKQEKLQKHI